MLPQGPYPRLKAHASAFGLAVLLVACQDLPTAPSGLGLPARATGGGLHLGTTPVVCTYGWKEDDSPRWVVRRDTIHFPRGEIAPSGQTVRYQIRTEGADGLLVYTGDCDVPYTEGALRRVDRHFGVLENGGADQFRKRRGMITTQGCVTDGACVLEPIVVKAPLKPNNDPDDPCTRNPDQCESGGGGDGGDGGGDGDGGGSTDEGSEGDNPPLQEGDTTRTACEKDAYGACIERDLRPDEWDELGKRINAVREDTHECRQAKGILQNMYGQGLGAGRFQLFDGYYKPAAGEQTYGYNSQDQYGRILVYDSYWIWRDQYLLIHEALHAYLEQTGMNLSMDVTQQHNWIRAHQIYC